MTKTILLVFLRHGVHGPQYGSPENLSKPL